MSCFGLATDSTNQQSRLQQTEVLDGTFFLFVPFTPLAYSGKWIRYRNAIKYAEEAIPSKRHGLPANIQIHART